VNILELGVLWGSIETAAAFHTRLIDAGIRAGFPEPPTIYDWRANALFLIGTRVDFSASLSMLLMFVCTDKFYSESDPNAGCSSGEPGCTWPKLSTKRAASMVKTLFSRITWAIGNPLLERLGSGSGILS
jgi:hypothetical protein